MNTVLVTGAAGFIGFHLCQKLLDEGYKVIGIDNLNDYYDVRMKERRLEKLKVNFNFKFHEVDFSKYGLIENLDYNFDLIFHLGAQAGVRYSIENPWAYSESNYLGTLNIFELARNKKIKRVIYASSSSVYGGNEKTPFSEEDRTDSPVSLYAATKKANEVLAHAYNHLYGIEMIGVRFFTVYGTYLRPDLALFKFVKKILNGDKIDIYNNGEMGRDFTYVGDIVSGLMLMMKNTDIKYEIFNLGGDNPVKLMDMVNMIEMYLGVDAKKNFMGMQAGDVKVTMADISKAKEILGWSPQMPIEKIIDEFCNWFKDNKDWLMDLEDAKQ